MTSQLGKIDKVFFPSPRAFVNFVCFIGFVVGMNLVVMAQGDPTKVLVSILGALYSYNEWMKEIKK